MGVLDPLDEHVIDDVVLDLGEAKLGAREAVLGEALRPLDLVREVKEVHLVEAELGYCGSLRLADTPALGSL